MFSKIWDSLLKTKSKIFACDSTEFGNEQNPQISPVTLGMPGVKAGRLWKFKPGEVDDWMRRISRQED